MKTMIFVNLPVANLPDAMAFYRALGYSHNPQFTDETAACIVISEDIYVMLLTHDKFREFTPKPIVDAATATEVLVSLSCESRDQVKDLVARAVAAGGTVYAEPRDMGFMYQHGFQDLDGHIWELFYMDPSAIRTD